MDSSKAVVLLIVAVIVAGTFAWSWGNLFESPDYDPEKAHLFLEHFHAECTAVYDDSICGDVVGDHHRRCFNEHLEPTPPELVDEQGPVLYDLRTYLGCMNEEVEERLDDID